MKAQIIWSHQGGYVSQKIYNTDHPFWLIDYDDFDAMVEQMAKALLRESKESPWMECADKPNYFHRARCALRSIGIRKPTRKQLCLTIKS